MLITKHKLRHNFDRHPVVVVSSSGLGDIINNRESIGHITKWGLELMGLNIIYAPSTVIKSQVLANFMVEWTEEQASTAPQKARVLDHVC